MATTLGEIVEAVGAALEGSDVQVVGYLRDNPVVPCAMVVVDEVRYHEAFALGNVAADVRVVLLVSRVVDDNSFESAYRYLDPTGDLSVRALLEADKTLGSVVDTLVVRSGGQVQPVEIGGITYLACEWQLTVHVS